MKYASNTCTDRAMQSNQSEPDRQDRLDNCPLRTDEEADPGSPAQQPARSTILREKAMAASAPGTEYWLP